MPKQNTAASGFGDEVGGRISGFRRLPAPSGFIGACLYDSKSQKPGEERVSLLPVPEKSVESSHPCAVDTLVLHPFRQDTAKFLL